MYPDGHTVPVSYNPNAVGKNRPLWRQLHKIAESYRLRLESDRLRKEIERMKARA
jgi:hypothetical protein